MLLFWRVFVMPPAMRISFCSVLQAMSSFTDPQAIFMLFERLKPVDSAIARPLSNKRDYNTHNM